MSLLRSFVVLVSLSSWNLTVDALAHSNSTDRIIGDNDLVQITADYANNPRIQAIGRMNLGCTATHVGNGIAISAGHCFARGNFEGVHKNVPCNDLKHQVRWGLTYGSEGYLTSSCTEIIASELNEERDYAIFRVFPVPTGSIGLNPETVSVDAQISIFSHPRKRHLEWSQWCKVEGLVGKSHGHQFYYSCDTEGGSSGAAVLDKNYHVVGIHNFYSKDLNRNAATMIASTPLAEILQDAAAGTGPGANLADHVGSALTQAFHNEVFLISGLGSLE